MIVDLDSALGSRQVAQQALKLQAGAADLGEETARRSADLLALRNQIAAAERNTAVQASLDAILQEKELELDAIEEQLLAWTNLRARFGLAVASGAAAALDVRQVDTNEADLQSADFLQSASTSEVSNLQDLVRVVAAATIVTAGVIALLAMAFGSGRRRSSEEGVPLDAPAGRPDSQKRIS